MRLALELLSSVLVLCVNTSCLDRFCAAAIVRKSLKPILILNRRSNVSTQLSLKHATRQRMVKQAGEAALKWPR